MRFLLGRGLGAPLLSPCEQLVGYLGLGPFFPFFDPASWQFNQRYQFVIREHCAVPQTGALTALRYAPPMRPDYSQQACEASHGGSRCAIRLKVGTQSKLRSAPAHGSRTLRCIDMATDYGAWICSLHRRALLDQY